MCQGNAQSAVKKVYEGHKNYVAYSFENLINLLHARIYIGV